MLRISFALFLTWSLYAMSWAQDDHQIFKVVEEMPRFPGCEEEGKSAKELADCAQQLMLQYIYQQIQYPDSARLKGTEGTVVVGFVVEKDGAITNEKILKNIGDGCGEEALKVVQSMRENGVSWVPGKQAGQPVRVEFTLPVRFKMEKVLDYVLVGRDSVYTVLEQGPSFKGGAKAREDYFTANFDFPADWKDSCILGDMEVSLLVRPNGDVYVLDISNYSNLPFDFLFEAILTTHYTSFQWNPAIYQGRKVGSTTNFTIPIRPKAGICPGRVNDFSLASKLADEGSALFNEGQQEQGLEKINQAVALFPENAQWRYLRGQALIQLKRFEEACEDYSYVRLLLNLPEVDQLTPIICRSNP